MAYLLDTPLKNVETVLSYRGKDIFQKTLSQYPDFLSSSELIIYPALMSIWISNIMSSLDLSLDNHDVDTADLEHLKLMSALVGYSWNDALPVNTNRTRLKYFTFRRKFRGTIDSLKNLIKTGYAEEGFFSNKANNSIGIIENGAMIIVTITDNEDTLILRDNIEEVRPAGTMLRFMYNFSLGFIDMVMKEVIAWTLAEIQQEPTYYKLETKIEEWYYGVEGTIGQLYNLPTLDYNTSYRYIVNLPDDLEVVTRPECQRSPITVEEYDALVIPVTKQDTHYEMLVTQFDKYFKYVKALRDNEPWDPTCKDPIVDINSALGIS